MELTTDSVVGTLLSTPNGDKLIGAARHLLRDDAVLFTVNTLWVQYARTEADILKSQRDDKVEAADLVRNKRLALDDLLDELGTLAETDLASDEAVEEESEDS